MNFLLLLLLELAACDDDSPVLTLSRLPVETLITDWLRRAEGDRGGQLIAGCSIRTGVNRFLLRASILPGSVST